MSDTVAAEGRVFHERHDHILKIVIDNPTKKNSFSPEELTLDKLRTYPQDMICAAAGLSTLLLDLPSGKDTKTYANKAEAREAAMEQNVIPTLDHFGDELDLQLLPEFDPDEWVETRREPRDGFTWVWWERR